MSSYIALLQNSGLFEPSQYEHTCTEVQREKLRSQLYNMLEINNRPRHYTFGNFLTSEEKLRRKKLKELRVRDETFVDKLLESSSLDKTQDGRFWNELNVDNLRDYVKNLVDVSGRLSIIQRRTKNIDILAKINVVLRRIKNILDNMGDNLRRISSETSLPPSEVSDVSDDAVQIMKNDFYRASTGVKKRSVNSVQELQVKFQTWLEENRKKLYKLHAMK